MNVAAFKNKEQRKKSIFKMENGHPFVTHFIHFPHSGCVSCEAVHFVKIQHTLYIESAVTY